MTIITPHDEQVIRYTICSEICPDFNHTTSQCKLCGCFMKVKTRLSGSHCTKDLWSNSEMIEKAKTIIQQKIGGE